MISKRKKVWVKVALLSACFFMTGYSRKLALARETEEPLRAVIFYQSQIWVQDINIMEQIARGIQKGLEGHAEVALSCYGLGNMTMSDVMEAAVNMKTDVLIYYGLNSQEALTEYQKLADHGIRLILVDGDAKESGRFAYIGTDNYNSGIRAAELVAEKSGTDTSIAVLAPDMETSLRSVGARLEGFKEGAEQNGLKITSYCETTYDSLTAIEKIEELLKEYPNLEVLFCAEAVSGQAAADVLGEQGLAEEITVMTYDRNENIEKDLKNQVIDVTFAQNTEEIGKACAKQLIELAENRSMETGTDMMFDCIPITAKDLEEEE